jgi:hypothetical protein
MEGAFSPEQVVRKFFEVTGAAFGFGCTYGKVSHIALGPMLASLERSAFLGGLPEWCARLCSSVIHSKRRPSAAQTIPCQRGSPPMHVVDVNAYRARLPSDRF